MPNRYLREGILDSDRVNSLSFEAEVFYRRLMSVVDDFGRFDGRVSILKGRLYALKPNLRETDISRWIAECVKAGLIALYQVDVKPYLLFHRLGEARAMKSKFPAPPAGLGDHLVSDVGKREHMNADANICSQTKTNAPSSSSVPITPTVNTPLPPTGGQDSKPVKIRKRSTTPKVKAEDVPIPESLGDDEFRTAWGDWLADRRDRNKSLTERAAKEQLAKLEPLGPHSAAECVRRSIQNGWTGIFPERESNGNGRHAPQPFPTKAEAQMNEFAEGQRIVNETERKLANDRAERNGQHAPEPLALGTGTDAG